jgi:hypothetical protein
MENGLLDRLLVDALNTALAVRQSIDPSKIALEVTLGQCRYFPQKHNISAARVSYRVLPASPFFQTRARTYRRQLASNACARRSKVF